MRPRDRTRAVPFAAFPISVEERPRHGFDGGLPHHGPRRVFQAKARFHFFARRRNVIPRHSVCAQVIGRFQLGGFEAKGLQKRLRKPIADVLPRVQVSRVRFPVAVSVFVTRRLSRPRVPIFQPTQKPLRIFPQADVIHGRENHQFGLLHRFGMEEDGPLLMLFEHHVHVRAASPERADASSPRGRALRFARRNGWPRPVLQFLLDQKWRMTEIDIGVRFTGVERWGQPPVLELEQHLGYRGDSGRGFEVSDVGLHRSYRQSARRRGRAIKSPGHACDFYRVPERGARAVSLDISDGRWVYARAPHRLPDQLGLRVRVGNGEPVRMPPVVHPGGPDYRVNGVPVRFRAFEGFQDDRSHSFARRVSVAPLPEAPAASAGRGEPPAVQPIVLARVEQEVHAPRDGHVRIPAPDGFASQMDRRKRRGAHRVERDAWSVQIQVVGNPVSYGRGRRTGGNGRARKGRLDPEELVGAVHHPHIHSNPFPLEAGWRVAGVFQRMPRGLEEKTLLGVHELGVPRGDVEKSGVEFVHALEEPSPDGFLRGIVPAVHGMAARRGRLRDAVPSLGEIVPECVQVRGHGIAAAHADNRHAPPGGFLVAPAFNRDPDRLGGPVRLYGGNAGGF